ncbi:Chemotaxis protein methyltransferase 2 [Rhodovastum atsumiense]|uniref:Chemotaxis protein methyltransferase n=1 Tax=Rhodovastum atsumiense TaxID=504468 RepID=A0A5M6IPA7_9PROT|nr:protein-glutamate O-methyltransferase [Rhodovastum atsumiense]KAA5610102.1 chemotaxis protein [Rhodovastum atsumiense]CAH2601426.1 Chemotaxis protein methyltransferase 2 [Rhodovastum atsumiense]
MNPADIVITDGEFARFQEFFYQKTGIVFGDTKRYFVDRRLADRIVTTKTGSFADYMTALRFFDPRAEELQNLINTMTVNETYFYREEYQFRCLVNAILPEVTHHRRREEPLQIWSVPCSTGEEPYSIALYMLENWHEVDDWDIRILASDIDTRVLEHARRGIYDARALQNLSPAARMRYFTRTGEASWQIVEDLRNSVEFRKTNITCTADMRRYRDMDVIFCRNLLIYFDDASRRRAAEAFYEALRPGGFVCLGHSESMSRISSLFTVRKFQDAIVYQRPM